MKKFIDKKPFFIAEISANHCGSFEKAKKLIILAKKNGADAVKLQTYTPDMMTIKNNKFLIKDGIWKNINLWKLYEEAQTPLIWHYKLFELAKKIKLKIFSTPFSSDAVDLLEKLKCEAYKIASFEMNDLNLIKRVSLTKKPLIISTGLSSIKEIDKTYKTAKKYGCKDITLLYCVSNYPSQKNDFSLNNIKILKERFNCKVGLSDHSIGNDIAKLSLAMGAEVFEKHIALQNQKKGHDIKFSIRGNEILKYKNDLLDTFELLNKKTFFRSKKELKNLVFRRSIFAIKKIKKGEKFSHLNVRTFRPNIGLGAEHFPMLIKKKSPYNIKKDTVIKKNIFKFYKKTD